MLQRPVVSLAPAATLIAKDSRERYITRVVGLRAYNIRVHSQTFHSDRIRFSPPRPDGYFPYVGRNADSAIFDFEFFKFEIEDRTVAFLSRSALPFKTNTYNVFAIDSAVGVALTSFLIGR